MPQRLSERSQMATVYPVMDLSFCFAGCGDGQVSRGPAKQSPSAETRGWRMKNW